MEKLVVAATRTTPEVVFDPSDGLLRIKGQSYPEDAYRFYEPLLQWLDLYLEGLESDTLVSIELHMPYINTSSTKCFMLMLDKFDAAFLSGKQIRIEWQYNADNESELECAEEFKEDLSLPFAIIPKDEQK